MLCFLPLVSHIYFFLLKEDIAEVRSQGQYPVKTGLNPPECSVHIVSETFLFMVLCLQSEDCMVLETKG